eukprot:15146031-Alexandrium_andersonii.AAC.1
MCASPTGRSSPSPPRPRPHRSRSRSPCSGRPRPPCTSSCLRRLPCLPRMVRSLVAVVTGWRWVTVGP